MTLTNRYWQQLRSGVLRSIIIVAGLTVCAIAVSKVTQYKMDSLKGVTYPQFSTLAEKERQLQCLALNIYREAGHEPFEGKVAVAQVTMNRVAHPQFPNDVCAVVYEKNVVYQRVICQFSWYCDSTHRNRPVNQFAYEESYEVAKKVLLEGFVLSSLTEAIYYHADYVNPKWGKERITQIGRHIFYSQRRAGEKA
jgi:spore germination cell wall hydrolase CwlJ-like protein